MSAFCLSTPFCLDMQSTEPRILECSRPAYSLQRLTMAYGHGGTAVLNVHFPIWFSGVWERHKPRAMAL